MSIKADSSKKYLPHQLMHGRTWHSRLQPSVHKFVYPYRYWGINISALAAGQTLPEVNAASSGKSKWLKRVSLFSAQKKALQQFCPDDYLQGLDLQLAHPQDLNSLSKNSPNASSNGGLDPVQAFDERLKQAFTQQTGSAPLGDIIGLLVCRNAGLYFSPVNFYLGFDEQQVASHLLAEVSNTPWDKRHYYGFLLTGEDTEFCHDKDFHVSPFNPIDQCYRWQVTINQQPNNCMKVRIAIDISDERGEVLKTGIKMSGVLMSETTIRRSLRQNPLMNVTSLTRIYWHAFKLYALKKVPYINYDETLAESQQQNADTSK